MSEQARAVDTSVAVPLVIASHEHHTSVVEWARGRRLHLSGHAAIETYSVLTRLPGDSRVTPTDAVALLNENFGDPLVLSTRGARDAHRVLARRGIAGGAAHDGLVALAAQAHDMVLVTRDSRARATYQALGVLHEILPTP